MNIQNIKKTYFPRTRRQRGFGLIEVVLGVSLLGMVLVGAVSVAQNSLRLNRQAMRESQAGFLAAEGVEVARAFRDESWVNISGLTVGTPYFLSWSGSQNKWATTTVGSYMDGMFWREIVISSVYRDANDDIALSGTIDEGTRKVRVSVSWRGVAGTSTKVVEVYLTDI